MNGVAYVVQSPSAIALAADSANWLFSACAQTAGAIVAIVGGFLVSSLIGMESRFNGLYSQMEGIEQRIDKAKGHLAQATTGILHWEVCEYALRCLHAVVSAKGDITPDELVSQWGLPPSVGDTADDLLQRMITAVRDVYRTLESQDLQWRRHGVDTALERLVADDGLGIPDLSKLVRRAVFHFIANKQRKEAPMTRSTLRTYCRSPDEQEEIARRRVKLDQAEVQAELALANLEGELEAVRTEIRSIGTPSGLGIAFVLLAVLSVAGIMVPLSLLPFGVAWNPTLKWGVLLPFYGALAAIFAWLLTKSVRLQQRIRFATEDLSLLKRIEKDLRELRELGYE